MEADREPGDRRLIADRTADGRKEVIPAKRAVEPRVVIAEQGDEEGLHARDEERPSYEENLAHAVECGVECRIAGTEREEGSHGRRVVQSRARLDEHVPHRDTEPTDADDDRFGRQGAAIAEPG